MGEGLACVLDALPMLTELSFRRTARAGEPQQPPTVKATPWDVPGKERPFAWARLIMRLWN